MMMDSSHHMMFLKILVIICLVYADVIREDGYNNYEGQFTVKHKGRMLRVLMYLRNVQQELCALRCVQHLRCRTYNYHHGKKDCELTDEEFDEMNADTITLGWYNYGTPTKVDGGWSSWRNFTECTKTCGNGTLEQWRGCDSPEPEHGGDFCKGKMRRRVKCNTHGCPVDGEWSSWRNSTNCTKTCGNGTLDQVRDCDSPKPEHGGANCTGVKKRTVKCGVQECPGKANGEWSIWRNSTKCTKSCGKGTLNQVRECNAPKSEHGGTDCTGEKKRTVDCNTHECPVDGVWSSWRDSTDCTKTCGSGTKEQRRDCDSSTPAHGGTDCLGVKKRVVECKTNKCPVDGKWSSWKDSTMCTKTCGGGELEQVRHCDSPKPEHGGANCSGEKKRIVECNNHGCNVVNVALGKSVKQSSTYYDNLHFYGPYNAIDGSIYTRSFTKYDHKPWLEIDLGEVKVITKIHIVFRRSQDFLVETRKSKGEAWNTCKNVGRRRRSAKPIKKKEFKCKEELTTSARFVIVRSKIQAKYHSKICALVIKTTPWWKFVFGEMEEITNIDFKNSSKHGKTKEKSGTYAYINEL